MLEPLAREDSPFEPARGGAAAPKDAHWVEPQLVGEVSFTERSKAGVMRHPVWRGLREDVPRMLVFEDERTLKGKGLGATARVGEREIPVTNLDKILYPAAGFAKRDAIEYSAQIAPVLSRTSPAAR